MCEKYCTLSCPEDAGTFWLALAKTQHTYGVLEPQIKNKAIEIIDNNIDLNNWQNRGASRNDIQKRAKILELLKDELNSTPTKSKRIRVKFKLSHVWQIGDIVSYNYCDGLYCLFRIVGFDDSDCICCYCELLDWIGEHIPNFEKTQDFNIVTFNQNEDNYYPQLPAKRFLLVFENKKQFNDKKLHVEYQGSYPKTNESDASTLIMWPYFQHLLTSLFE